MTLAICLSPPLTASSPLPFNATAVYVMLDTVDKGSKAYKGEEGEWSVERSRHKKKLLIKMFEKVFIRKVKLSNS